MGLDKNQLVKVYLNRLVRSLVPIEVGEEFIQSVSTNLFNDLIHEEGDFRSYDTNQMLNQIKTVFLSQNDESSWIKFQNLLDQLSNLKSNDDLVKYLVFLLELKGEDRRKNSTSTLQKPSFIVPQTHNHGSLPTRISTISPQQQIPTFQFSRNTSPMLQKSPYLNSQYRQSLKNSFNHILPSSRHSSVSLVEDPLYRTSEPLTRFDENSSKPLADLIAPYYQDSEPMILKYISYTLLGLDSKILSYDDVKNQLILPKGLNSSYLQLLSAICECGLLYRTINQFTKKYRPELKSPIKIGYLTFVEQNLYKYSDFINQIFNDSTSSSSLITIYHNIFPWIYSLRLLYYLNKTSSQTEISGDNFLSQVYQLTKFGDLTIKSLSSEIFQYIGRPYYEILEHWIIRGELIDESNDFFIKFNTNTTNFNDIIEYLPNKIPSFIPESIGYKVFQIGKTLIFLNKYCKQLNWISNYSEKYSRIIYQKNQGLQSMKINEISRIINLQFSQLMEYLTIVLYGNFNHLFVHLINFKRFYLLENNDFIENLILKGEDIFNDTSTSVTSNQLSTLLTESISTTSVSKNSNIDRLDARVLDWLHGNLGWDVFTLEYRIDDLPIQYLLSFSMHQYLKMFNFFWKIRQLQNLLNQSYLLSNNLKKIELEKIFNIYKNSGEVKDSIRFKKVKWIVKSFNTINMIRFQLINNLNAIVNYLSFDVIETSFQKNINKKLFKSVDTKSELININPDFIYKLSIEQLKDINQNISVNHNMNELNIDEIIEIHTTYLNKICKNKLLNEDTHGKYSGLTFIEQLYSLLELIFEFIKSSEHYYGILINYILILNIDQQDIEMDQDIILAETSLQKSFVLIYRKIYHNYKNQLDSYTKDLKADLDLQQLSKLF